MIDRKKDICIGLSENDIFQSLNSICFFLLGYANNVNNQYNISLIKVPYRFCYCKKTFHNTKCTQKYIKYSEFYGLKNDVLFINCELSLI